MELRDDAKNAKLGLEDHLSQTLSSESSPETQTAINAYVASPHGDNLKERVLLRKLDSMPLLVVSSSSSPAAAAANKGSDGATTDVDLPWTPSELAEYAAAATAASNAVNTAASSLHARARDVALALARIRGAAAAAADAASTSRDLKALAIASWEGVESATAHVKQANKRARRAVNAAVEGNLPSAQELIAGAKQAGATVEDVRKKAEQASAQVETLSVQLEQHQRTCLEACEQAKATFNACEDSLESVEVQMEDAEDAIELGLSLYAARAIAASRVQQALSKNNASNSPSEAATTNDQKKDKKKAAFSLKDGKYGGSSSGSALSLDVMIADMSGLRAAGNISLNGDIDSSSSGGVATGVASAASATSDDPISLKPTATSDSPMSKSHGDKGHTIEEEGGGDDDDGFGSTDDEAEAPRTAAKGGLNNKDANEEVENDDDGFGSTDDEKEDEATRAAEEDIGASPVRFRHGTVDALSNAKKVLAATGATAGAGGAGGSARPLKQATCPLKHPLLAPTSAASIPEGLACSSCAVGLSAASFDHVRSCAKCDYRLCPACFERDSRRANYRQGTLMDDDDEDDEVVGLSARLDGGSGGDGSSGGVGASTKKPALEDAAIATLKEFRDKRRERSRSRSRSRERAKERRDDKGALEEATAPVLLLNAGKRRSRSLEKQKQLMAETTENNGGGGGGGGGDRDSDSGSDHGGSRLLKNRTQRSMPKPRARGGAAVVPAARGSKGAGVKDSSSSSSCEVDVSSGGRAGGAVEAAVGAMSSLGTQEEKTGDSSNTAGFGDDAKFGEDIFGDDGEIGEESKHKHWYNLAIECEDEAKLEEALEAYERALELKEDFAECYYNMVRFLCQRRVQQNDQSRPVNAFQNRFAIYFIFFFVILCLHHHLFYFLVSRSPPQGLLLERMDDPELAEDAYQSAIFHFTQEVDAINAHHNRLERRQHRLAKRQERLMQKNSSSGKSLASRKEERRKRRDSRQEGPLSWDDDSSDDSGSEYSERGDGEDEEDRWSGPEDWTEDWADDWADGNPENPDGNDDENPDGSMTTMAMTYPPLLAQCHYNYALLLHERRALGDAALQYQLAVDCRAAQGEGL